MLGLSAGAHATRQAPLPVRASEIDRDEGLGSTGQEPETRGPLSLLTWHLAGGLCNSRLATLKGGGLRALAYWPVLGHHGALHLRAAQFTVPIAC